MKDIKPYGRNNPDLVFVSPTTTKILASIVWGKLPVVAPALPSPVSLRWGEIVLEAEDLGLEREGTHLALTVYNPSHDAILGTRGNLQHQADGKAAILLEDGREITARFCAWSGGGGSFDKDRGGYTYEKLQLDLWKLPPKASASAWIVPLPSLRLPEGNLSVVDAAGQWTSRNLRLRGRYDYFLVGRHKRAEPVLVIDTNGVELDPDLLGADMVALEIALGRNVPLQFAYAVDEEGALSGMLGLGFEHEDDPKAGPPVPTRHDVEGCWTSVFFEKFAAKLHEEGSDSPLFVASVAFLDSLPARLDTAYLLLQIGLEGFCKSISPRSGSPERLVSDLEAWKAFIAENEAQIMALAQNAPAGEQLLRKLRDSVTQPSTSDIVKAAFRRFEVELPREAIAEIGRRNQAAHSFVMSARESTRNWRHDLVRVDMVRTMLVAAISQHIGYDGPIVGWEKDNLGWPTVPSWWKRQDVRDAHLHYVADEDP